MSATTAASVIDSSEHDVDVEAASGLDQKATAASSHYSRTDKRLEVINIRRAARINAANIDDIEVQSLLEERQQLVTDKFSSGLSVKQERRLAYIRWSLDRIQDARNGESLDHLESVIAQYEIMGDEIRNLISSLESYSRPSVRK